MRGGLGRLRPSPLQFTYCARGWLSDGICDCVTTAGHSLGEGICDCVTTAEHSEGICDCVTTVLRLPNIPACKCERRDRAATELQQSCMQMWAS